jgi:hypothetical protein
MRCALARWRRARRPRRGAARVGRAHGGLAPQASRGELGRRAGATAATEGRGGARAEAAARPTTATKAPPATQPRDQTGTYSAYDARDPVKGKALPDDSRTMRALEAYILSQRQGEKLDIGKH